MLALSRKRGETLHLGDSVVIEVRRISGSRVTLAIDAPRELRILRGEIREAATEFEQSPTELPVLDRTNGKAIPVADGALPNEQTVKAPMPAEPYVVSHPPLNANGVHPSL